MYGIAFEWDRTKEATTVVDDPLSITIPDPCRAIGEE
jgi:hypothetical protein